MASIKLKLDICPQAKQSVKKGKNKKTGKDIFYTPADKKKYQNDLIALIKSQIPCGFKTINKPTMVCRLIFYMPPTKTMLKSKKIRGRLDLGFQIFHVVKPDLVDNLKKPLFDALTQAGVIKDDSIVCWETNIKKLYRHKTGIEIELKEIGEN